MAGAAAAPAAPPAACDAGGAPVAAARPRSPAWVRDFGSTGLLIHAQSVSKLADGVGTGAASVSKLADGVNLIAVCLGVGLFVLGGANVLAAVVGRRLPQATHVAQVTRRAAR
jgi:hypothetical protein